MASSRSGPMCSERNLATALPTTTGAFIRIRSCIAPASSTAGSPQGWASESKSWAKKSARRVSSTTRTDGDPPASGISHSLEGRNANGRRTVAGKPPPQLCPRTPVKDPGPTVTATRSTHRSVPVEAHTSGQRTSASACPRDMARDCAAIAVPLDKCRRTIVSARIERQGAHTC